MKKKECFKAIVWLKPQSGTCNAATATAHQFPFRSELDCLLQQQRNHVIAAAVSGKKKNIFKNLPFFSFPATQMNVLFAVLQTAVMILLTRDYGFNRLNDLSILNSL